MALRERIEIIVSGGRPWGFSIKGGKESNKPLTISKLVEGGKAECGGLFVGDVLHSINGVLLHDSKTAAVDLVKSSGYYLTVEVERGSLPGRGSSRYPSYGSNPYQGQRPHSSDYDQGFYNAPNRLLHGSPELEPRQSEAGASRGFPSLLSASSLSLNDPLSMSRDVALSQEDPFSSNSDLRETSRNFESHQPEVSYPTVKLRAKKARDRGIPTERPRSWHASKHPDPTYSKEDPSMRSPGSGYLTGHSSSNRFYQQQPVAAPRRRSKGWIESGDLKSAYKPEVNGSRDSLISADSHRSYRSGRLSVSSSKSSGTMSSSRGSLENLLEGGSLSRYGGLESNPQPVLTSKYKQSPSAHPQAGIVSHQKNIFERLSHESAVDPGYVSRSRDDLDRAGRSRHQFPASRDRDQDKVPPPSNRLSPPASQPNVARRSDDSQEATTESHCNKLQVELSPTVTSGAKYSDAKIVKTTTLDHFRKSPHQTVPEPPQRDRSSAIAVNRYSKSFPNSQIENSRKARRSSSPHDRPQLGKSPPGGQIQQQQSAISAEPSHRLTVTRPIEKTVESGGRQERMFGVMSVGESGNIVAASVTVSPKLTGEQPKGHSPEQESKPFHSKKTNHVREGFKSPATDYVSRMAIKADDHRPTTGSNRNPAAEHVKSRSDEADDSKSKGKYGSIWKTPQNQHNRTRSANVSSLVHNWSSREKSTDSPKQTEIFSNDATPHKDQTDQSETNESTPYIDNQPSLLRSLQNSKQHPSSEPRSTKDNYDLLWHSESASRLSNNRETSAKSKNNSSFNDWRSDFKEVILDDSPDDVSSPTHRYVDDIKDMSRKVLRETSFTRKDLGVQNLSQKLKQFSYQATEPGRKSSAYHPRSHSYGNDIDEVEPTSSNADGLTPASVGKKPRPLSAGVFRSRTDRHAPAVRTVLSPSHPHHPVKQVKSEPRFQNASLGADDLSPFNVKHSKASQNRRVSIDVKPELSTNSEESGIKSDRRSAVLDYLSKKSGKGFDNPAVINGSRVHNLSTDEIKITPKSHTKAQDCGSVRKLKNFKETRQKFLLGFEPLSRAKSTSSLLEDDPPKIGASIQRKMRNSERAASLENLLETKQTVSSAPPSNDVTQSPPQVTSPDRPSNPSSSVTSFSTKTEITIQPPPRKHSKNHRQRISNSSSASSSTTISTLSSYSTTSSTSVGVFPPLGEESEHTRSSSPSDAPPSSVTNEPMESTLTATPTKSTNQIEADCQLRRPPIDTSTYRVQKRRSGGKPKSIDPNQRRSAHDSDGPDSVPRPLTDVKGFETVQSKAPEPVPADENETSGNVFYSESFSSKALPPPPPPPGQPLDSAAEKLLSELVRRRQSCDLPPPPSVPFKPTADCELTEESSEADMTSSIAQPPPPEPRDPLRNGIATQQPDLDARRSSAHSYENVRRTGQQYENVCGPARSDPVPELAASSKPDMKPEVLPEKTKESDKLPESAIKISPEPLLPDVPFLHDPASLQEEHPDLTRDIIKGDKALAQVLSTTNKKAIDYMAGVFPQSAHDILEEGIRYRKGKPGAAEEEKAESTYQSYLTSDLNCHDNLPASSTYYKTSASKAKILNLMKEKLADGEMPLEELESVDEVNRKKVQLVLSIKNKLDDLHSMKGLLDVERRENEILGKQVLALIKNMCSAREQDKYYTFVQEVDKIINLLLGLSARLARVENAIQMLPHDADKQEMEQLCEKRKKLTEQHNDAKQLKESIDKRQKSVSETLAGYFNREQFADYEHYIKMKSALIMEQREYDDKSKLGQEQIQCLRESLSDEWQANLDKLLEQ